MDAGSGVKNLHVRCGDQTDRAPLADMQDSQAFEGFVRSLSRRHMRQGLDLEDLEQEARLAVLSALADAANGDASTASSLKNFVCFRIRDRLKTYRRAMLGDERFLLCEACRSKRRAGKKRERRCVLCSAIPTFKRPLSLEAETFPSSDEETALSLHEMLGVRGDQETDLELQDARYQIAPSDLRLLELKAEGLTYPEIGRELGRSPRSVESAVYRVRCAMAAWRDAA